MKPDWRGVYRPRAASGTTAYSGAAGPHKRPSQDEAGGMLQCHTARTRQHRLPRKKGRPVFSGLAVLHDLEFLPLEIRAWIVCLSSLVVWLLQHSGGTKAEFFQCNSILHLKRRGSTFMGVQLAKGILCESSIIQQNL